MRVKDCYNIPEDLVRIIDHILEKVYPNSVSIMDYPLDSAVNLLKDAFTEYKDDTLKTSWEYGVLVHRKEVLEIIANTYKGLNTILLQQIDETGKLIEDIKAIKLNG